MANQLWSNEIETTPSHDNDAIVMVAAGKGSRVSKYTDGIIPKCLLSVNTEFGRMPALVYYANLFSNDQIPFYLLCRSADESIIVSVMDTFDILDKVIVLIDDTEGELGSAHSIGSIKQRLHGKNVWFIWSDLLMTDPVFTFYDYAYGYIGVVESRFKTCRYYADPDKQTVTHGEAPTTLKDYQVIGLYYVPKFDKIRYKNALSRVNTGRKEVDLADIYVELLPTVGFKAMDVTEGLIDFGSNEEYEKVKTSRTLIGRSNTVINIYDNGTVVKDHADRDKAIEEYTWLTKASPSVAIPCILVNQSIFMPKVGNFLIDLINNGEVTAEQAETIVIDLSKKIAGRGQLLTTKTALLESVNLETVGKINARYTDDIRTLLFKLGVNVERLMTIADTLSKTIYNEYATHYVNAIQLPFAHGDLNFSNVYRDADGTYKVIDPRHGFGKFKQYCDPLYDLSKVTYALLGYDNFNKAYPHVPGTKFIKLMPTKRRHKLAMYWALFHVVSLAPLQTFDLIKMRDTADEAIRLYDEFLLA